MNIFSAISAKRKIWISILFGILGLVLSPYGINVTLGEISVGIPWSLFFPIIIAMAFGWRLGVLSGLSGGALFPFLLWNSNGWVNLSTTLVYLFFYALIGVAYDKSIAKPLKKIPLRAFIAITLFILVCYFYYVFLFNPILNLNPAFWVENTINHLPMKVLYGFLLKESVNIIILTVFSGTIIRLPIVRKVLSLAPKQGSQSNHQIFLITIVISILIWLSYYGLDVLLFEKDQILPSQHVLLSLLVIVGSGLFVMQILFSYAESQNRMQRRLNKSEEKFRAIFENSNDAILLIEKEIFVDCNRATLKIFGCTFSDIIGKSPFDFSPLYQSDGEPSTEKSIQFKNSALNGIPVRFEWQHIRHDGTAFDAEVSLSSLKVNSKILIQSIIRDISDRKTNEENLKKSEQMLQTVLDNFPGVVFWKDAHSNYLGCNLAFAHGAGLNSSAEIVGKTDFDLPWATSEAEHYRNDDFEVMKSGNAKMHIIEMQHQVEGHVIWLDTSKIPIVDSNDQVIGVIGVSTDITEMKQIQEVISEKNKELENYLYIASHDLRSPLVNIQGFSQRLQKQADTIKAALVDCPIDKETKAGIDEITNSGIPKTLNFIFSNVTKMDTLINGLLQISRTGRMAMTIRKIDMNNLIKTIITAHNFQITELAANVIIEDLVDCFGDENQLNQIFSNIIGNAIKYSDKNRQLVLKIASGTHYNKVIYTIKDTGIGIAPRHLEKIWDVFYRINSEVSQGGEGIGLSLAKRLVDKHKGKIWAESEEGKGSTFFVELQKNEFNE